VQRNRRKEIKKKKKHISSGEKGMDFVTGDIVGSNDNGKKKNEECGSMTE
jgi:hypothetical protein